MCIPLFANLMSRQSTTITPEAKRRVNLPFESIFHGYRKFIKKKKSPEDTSVSVLLQSSIGCYLVMIGGGHAEGEWNAAEFKRIMPWKGRFGHRAIASTHHQRGSELSGTVYDHAAGPEEAVFHRKRSSRSHRSQSI